MSQDISGGPARSIETLHTWGNFKQVLDLRNSLTHPKTPPPKVTEQSVERALQTILQLLDVVYRRIYSKKYPARQLGLDSNVQL
jgi:hypothetical protein